MNWYQCDQIFTRERKRGVAEEIGKRRLGGTESANPSHDRYERTGDYYRQSAAILARFDLEVESCSMIGIKTQRREGKKTNGIRWERGDNAGEPSKE